MEAYNTAKSNGEYAVMPEPIPALNPGDVLLQGHTHVSSFSQLSNGVININPGSISIPKGGSSHGYLTFEDGVFVRHSMDGNAEMRYDMNPVVEETAEAEGSEDQ